MNYKSWFDSLSWQDKIRQKTIRRIYRVEEWIDHKYDYPNWNDNTEKLRKVLCFFFGHSAQPDHCGIPSHDLCEWCGKPMPNQAKRGEA